MPTRAARHDRNARARPRGLRSLTGDRLVTEEAADRPASPTLSAAIRAARTTSAGPNDAGLIPSSPVRARSREGYELGVCRAYGRKAGCGGEASPDEPVDDAGDRVMRAPTDRIIGPEGAPSASARETPIPSAIVSTALPSDDVRRNHCRDPTMTPEITPSTAPNAAALMVHSRSKLSGK